MSPAGWLRARVARLSRTFRVALRFLPYARPHAGALAGALGLGVAVALSEVLRPWPLQAVFDQVLMHGHKHSHPLPAWLASWSPAGLVGAAAAAMLLISLMGGFAAYGQATLLSNAGQRVVARIRRDVFRHLMLLPPAFHSRSRHGDLLMRLTGDIVLLRELLVGGMLDGFAAVLVLVGTLGVMLWLDPGLTLLSLAVAPPVALAGALLGGRIRRVVRKSRDKEGLLAGRAGEALGAVALLQAFGAAGTMTEMFERANRSSLRSGLKASRLEALLARTLDLLTAAGTAVTLAFGTWSVLSDRLTPGGLLVFLAYQRTLYRPIRRLARVAARSAKSTACGERLLEVLETPPAITDRPGARPCPALRGEVRFEGVTLRYERGDLALAGVDLLVPAGSTVVIRGESGAGKTSLISLLPRLLDPTTGRVLVDGHDVRDLTLESLRSQIAMVFQDSVLLGLSLRENIALGLPDAAAAEVEEAARRAGVLRFAHDLPHGLDTVVGERGADLSGGQRQRVALARAALRNASILVLDEPFAHLDESNRTLVLEALREVAADRTLLVVTHQDADGLRGDLEVVMAAGRVVSRRVMRPGAGSRGVEAPASAQVAS